MKKNKKAKKAKKKVLKKKPKKALKRKKKAAKKVQNLKPAEAEEVQIPPEEEIHKTKIRVIGIGGGAGSIISELSFDVKRADFFIADTDEKSLNEVSKKVRKFQFGQSLTKGLGTGMNDQVGEQAAVLEKEKIKKLLEGQDLVIFVACLGGGTASGALPVFAKLARNTENLLTYGIFTLPFEFEGEKKMEMALRALEKIKPCLNTYSVIPNERIFQIIDKNTPLNSALSAINTRLADNLEGLIEMIYLPGVINIDFADLTTVFGGRGKLSYLNTIEIDSLGKEDSVNKLVSSSLYPFTIKGAKGIIYNIRGNHDLKLSEVSYISKIISQQVNRGAKIIFGINQNKSFQNRISIVLLAVGCSCKMFTPKYPNLERAIKPVKTLAAPMIKKIKRAKRPVKKPKPQAVIQPESEEVEVKIRRNGIEVKKAQEEEQKVIQEQEKFWETPAIFRKNNDN